MSFFYHISNDLTSQLQKFISTPQKIFILHEIGVTSIQEQLELFKGDNIFFYGMEGGENKKSIQSVEHISTQLMNLEISRNDLMIVMGGGALCDLGAFIASIYMRGIRLILIPTTLLGIVDAAFGGKTAINFHSIKNILGTFYPAELVICAPLFLSTLPQRQINSGMAEVIKYAFIEEKELFPLLKTGSHGPLDWNKIIELSLKTKKKFVTPDPHDKSGLRAVLNWGHTIGHAIESLGTTHCGSDSITHGEAISIGMAWECYLGQMLGFTCPDLYVQLTNYLERFNLPITLPNHIKSIAKKILPLAASTDKKRSSTTLTLPIIVLKNIGVVHELIDIPLDTATSILKDFLDPL